MTKRAGIKKKGYTGMSDKETVELKRGSIGKATLILTLLILLIFGLMMFVDKFYTTKRFHTV